jgi:hypothetical protein
MLQTVEPDKNGLISTRIKVSFLFQGLRLYFDDDKEERNCYVVTVSYKGKKAQFTYGDSIADTHLGLKPKKRDILEIITSDFFYTREYYTHYEDFAKEFGYDEDSIKGLQTYEKCLKQGEKLHKVFTEDDIRKLSEELNNA